MVCLIPISSRRRVRRGASGVVSLLVYLSLFAPVAASASDDPLLPLLAGEFALQEGAVKEAADLYARAALAATDPRLAERAARIGVMADESNSASRALQRWRELDPKAAALAQIELAWALKQADALAARQALTTLLQAPDGWRFAVQALAGEAKSLVSRALLAELAESAALPDDIDALLAVGGLALRLELPGVAQKISARVTRAHPDSARAWLWQAELARAQDDPVAARQAIETALALPELKPELRMLAAQLLDALGESAAAATALASGEQTDATLAARAAYLARAEDETGLAALYQEMQAGAAPTDPARLYLLGQLAELQKHTDEALAWYGAIADGEQRELAQLRIAVLLDGRDDTAAALARLHELQASDSENGQVLIDAYLLEAELLQKRGRGEQALDALVRGLNIFEDEPALLYSRALAYEKLNRLDAAEADFRRLLELQPDSADAMNALGYTLADRTNRLDEAYQLIKRALKLKPDNAAIVDSMGWVLFRMGRVEEALPHLRRAFELQRDAEVAAHLGEALWANGQHDEARSIWRLGQEIDPNNRALKNALERLAPPTTQVES